MTTARIGARIDLSEFDWAADTGCFSKPHEFDPDRYIAFLADRRYAHDRCLFATAPDRWADAAETLRVASPVLPRIREVGVPAALVAQAGLRLSWIDWSTFDVLFVGGPNEWQFSPECRQIMDEALNRGIHLHIGRVNTKARIEWAFAVGAHSIDGTRLAFGPDEGFEKLSRWLDHVHRQLPLATAQAA